MIMQDYICSKFHQRVMNVLWFRLRNLFEFELDDEKRMFVVEFDELRLRVLVINSSYKWIIAQ